MDTLQLLSKLVDNANNVVVLNYKNEWKQIIPSSDSPNRWCHQVHFIIGNILGKFSLDDKGYVMLKFGDYSFKAHIQGSEFKEHEDLLNKLDTILEPEFNKVAADKNTLFKWLAE